MVPLIFIATAGGQDLSTFVSPVPLANEPVEKLRQSVGGVYICMTSTLTTSPFIRRAKSTPSFVFPTPVVPIITMILGLAILPRDAALVQMVI